MIITSFIAAALAAVTGVSTVRVPGGNQQQVETKPACACEFAVSEIANYESFMRNMRTFARVGERSTDLDLRKAASVVSGIYSEMRFASFVPERVTLYNVYQTKEKNGAFYHKPKAFPKRYEEVFRYSMISFSDKAGVDTASFIVGDSTSLGSVRPNVDVTVVNLIDDGMRKETVAKMVDCFVTGGLTESNLLKFYVDHTAEDLLYLDPDDFAPIEVIDFFEIMYGGIHPTDGNHDDDWWLWYEEWLRLQNIIL